MVCDIPIYPSSYLLGALLVVGFLRLHGSLVFKIWGVVGFMQSRLRV